MRELSYVHGASSTPLLCRTIGQQLDRAAQRYGQSEAVVSRHQGIRLTYAELRTAAEEAARGLLTLDVRKGDRVGIWSPNNVEWMVVQYATAKIGAILVNINPAYRTHELRYALEQSGCSALIAARRFRQTDYAEMIDEVRPALPMLREVILLGEGEEGAAHPGTRTWRELFEGAASTSVASLREREAALDFDDAINIQYTSGTTGFPKGATLSHHNILNNGLFIAERLRLGPNDRVCLPVPLYHCFGMVLGNLAFLTCGGTVVLPSETFDARASLEAIEVEACTTLYGVPTMFIGILEHPEFESFKVDTLRTGIMAGSPCPVEVMRKTIERLHMDQVTIAYGMTETSPVSFQSTADDDLEARVSTVGSIHPHVECKVIDPETGKTVPRGTPGELCTRGYIVMLGYWRNDEATDQAIDDARWMHTGDLAVMNENGYVNIVGRIKDMIIRGGENIYPREIEEFLYTHPQIADVSVIGVPDVKYGEQVCAWIIPREGAELTEKDVKDFCRGKIATFKIPHYVRFTAEFPMTVTGKIQKFKMRAQSIEELGLQEAATTRTA
ncbi:MAG: AMP-binding protein [Egibacteraceae bacterium]